jgi:hypothetical protein
MGARTFLGIRMHGMRTSFKRLLSLPSVSTPPIPQARTVWLRHAQPAPSLLLACC